MCLDKVVMQDWSDMYQKILERSDIKEYLHGIYVDDGRTLMDKLKEGSRYVESERKCVVTERARKEDIERGDSREDITKREVLLAMNSVNPDLKFTLEHENDFNNKRLPTLSFEVWSEKKMT